MDYKAALEKLESLRAAIEKQRAARGSQSPDDFQRLCILYGEAEEIITRFAGISKVQVPLLAGDKPAEYPNFIEAGYLSGRTIHQHEGYTLLLKVIGRVRQAANVPHAPAPPPTLTTLVQILRRFRECCQYIQMPPQNEREVQDILWIMLRSQYERVDREDTLPIRGNLLEIGKRLGKPRKGGPA
jgi:hypothetical protein